MTESDQPDVSGQDQEFREQMQKVLEAEGFSSELATRFVNAPAIVENTGSLLLYWAVKQDNSDLVRMLLERGVKSDPEESAGWTALNDAIEVSTYTPNRREIINLLFAKDTGIDLNAKGESNPLYHAVKRDDLETARRLIEMGVKPDDVTVGGIRVLLHVAIQMRGHEMVRLLLESGAAPRSPDARGRSPRGVAEVTMRDASAELIERYEKRLPKR